MNQNWRYIFPKKVEHFKALIVNNKSKLQQQNENKLTLYVYSRALLHTRRLSLITSLGNITMHRIKSKKLAIINI